MRAFNLGTGIALTLGLFLAQPFQLGAASNVQTSKTVLHAKDLFFDGFEGDSRKVDESGKLLESRLREKPDDPLTLAYLGNVRLQQSSRAFAPWRKGSLAKEGMEMLDRAVDLSPENLEIRFLRGAATFHLPGFFRRGGQSASDLQTIAPKVMSAANAGQIERRIAAASLYYYGMLLEKKSDRSGALAAFAKAAEVGPETKAGQSAARKLAGS